MQSVLLQGSPRLNGFHTLDYWSHRVGNKAECPKEQTHQLSSQLSNTPYFADSPKRHVTVIIEKNEQCQACKISRLTVRWPIISMPLPEGPDIAVSVDYFGPVPFKRIEVTPSSCSSPIVSAADPTCSQFLQPNLQLRAGLTFSSTGIFPAGGSRAAYLRITPSRFAQSFVMPSTSFLEFGKLPLAPTTQNGNGGVECVNRTMARMLAMLVNEL